MSYIKVSYNLIYPSGEVKCHHFPWKFVWTELFLIPCPMALNTQLLQGHLICHIFTVDVMQGPKLKSPLALMHCYHHPEILHNCWRTRVTSFSFCTGPHTVCTWSCPLNCELLENRNCLLFIRKPLWSAQRTPSIEQCFLKYLLKS